MRGTSFIRCTTFSSPPDTPNYASHPNAAKRDKRAQSRLTPARAGTPKNEAPFLTLTSRHRTERHWDEVPDDLHDSRGE
jgi:hypothetical protein